MCSKPPPLKSRDYLQATLILSMIPATNSLCSHCEAVVAVITTEDSHEPRVACEWHKTPQPVEDSAQECVLCRNIWETSLGTAVREASTRYPGISKDALHISLSVRDRTVRGCVRWASVVTEVNVQGEAMVYEQVDLIGLSSQSDFWDPAADRDSEAEKRLSQVSEWLQVCESDHPECKPGAPSSDATTFKLPSRLLEVPRTTTGASIRLIQTEAFGHGDLAMRPLRYATLSYCWGNILPIMTTKSTIPQFEAVVPEESLPKTFRDAIRIIRALGIEYLWIDALCILQDDGDDWQRESAKMMDVYSGSVLTIAASDALDSMGGCLPTEASPSKGEAESSTTTKLFTLQPRDAPSIAARLERSTPWKNQRDTHLNTRGWTFQERILSHRVVHCMDAEIHWECRHSYKTQAGHEATTPPEETVHSGARRWAGWVEDYSWRLFTHPSDRPAALYGVVRRQERMTGHKPLLGLWDETMCLDLLWMRLGRCGPPPVGMPSWTWLACDACVGMDLFFTSPMPIYDDLTLVRGHISWTGEPFVSTVKTSELRVRAPVAIVRLRTTEKSRRFKPPYMEVEGEELDASRPIPWPVAAQFDEEIRTAEEFESFTCLLACTQNDGHSQVSTRGFLMVERVKDGDGGIGVYRRIGVGRHTGDNSPFDGAKVEVMDLV